MTIIAAAVVNVEDVIIEKPAVVLLTATARSGGTSSGSLRVGMGIVPVLHGLESLFLNFLYLQNCTSHFLHGGRGVQQNHTFLWTKDQIIVFVFFFEVVVVVLPALILLRLLLVFIVCGYLSLQSSFVSSFFFSSCGVFLFPFTQRLNERVGFIVFPIQCNLPYEDESSKFPKIQAKSPKERKEFEPQ